MSYNNPSSSYQTGQNQQPLNTTAEPYNPNLSSYETGPAQSTAGPHSTDFANKLDPRVDSDLNNRAQYAPGTTTTTNTHPGATAYATTPAASNQGPYDSSLKNKLDPRVDSKTGEMTTKTTNQSGGTGPLREGVNPGSNQAAAGSSVSGGGVVGGSSTGAPALPSRTDAPPEYSPATQGTTGNQPATTTTTSGGKTGGIGSGIKDTLATLHGAGEAIRGNVNAAIDRTFNEPEGVAKNEAIGREGQYEAQSGQFAPSTKQREGFNTRNRNV